MSARNQPLSITHECRNCGHHHPNNAVMPEADGRRECPKCYSGEIVQLELVDSEWMGSALNKVPSSSEYTVVFRMDSGNSRKAFMQQLTETFVDHEVEILEIQSGNKLNGLRGA
ncbi:hypothetical protein [Pseudomonas syringae group sp. J309-1]|uniref:hypothetical protein n=1 Tax=Pseudomonas syringae group sp. J309-1 TaxID=3079588 RepID=UPI00291267BB|nr:hypothetical protein [Pseudomonas syringae group sp. J309-1]MDU8358509.1 hypothetical protein [Pseudomonas syringae group sp. J309-1]